MSKAFFGKHKTETLRYEPAVESTVLIMSTGPPAQYQSNFVLSSGPKTSKTLFGPVNFSAFFKRTI
jgi:hypothetical protein